MKPEISILVPVCRVAGVIDAAAPGVPVQVFVVHILGEHAGLAAVFRWHHHNFPDLADGGRRFVFAQKLDVVKEMCIRDRV